MDKDTQLLSERYSDLSSRGSGHWNVSRDQKLSPNDKLDVLQNESPSEEAMEALVIVFNKYPNAAIEFIKTHREEKHIALLNRLFYYIHTSDSKNCEWFRDEIWDRIKDFVNDKGDHILDGHIKDENEKVVLSKKTTNKDDYLSRLTRDI